MLSPPSGFATRMTAGASDDPKNSGDARMFDPPDGSTVDTIEGHSSISTHIPTEKFVVDATWTVVAPCATSAAKVVPQLEAVGSVI